MKPGLSLILIAVAGASLTACGRQDGDDVPEADAFATTAGRDEDQFGKEFGKAYRADPNSEPVVVTEGAVPPVSLTSEPLPID